MFTLYKGGEGSPYPGYGNMNGAAVDPKTNIAYAFWSKNNGAKAIIRFGPDNTGQSYTLNGVTKADGALMRWIAYTPYGYSTAAAIDANGDGAITVLELRSHLGQVGYTDVTISKLFTALDTNADGEVSREEMRESFAEYDIAALRKARAVSDSATKTLDDVLAGTFDFQVFSHRGAALRRRSDALEKRC